MKKIVYLFLVCIALTGCETSGAKGQVLITAQDKAYINETLSHIKLGMSKEDVAEIIGQRYTNQMMIIFWTPPHSGSNSQIRAYFIHNKLTRLTWLKMSGFTSYVKVYEMSDETN